MKKRILGTILCFLSMALFIPVAHAEEMKVKVTASPAELSDTGEVVFSFEIANYSVYEMSDIKINILGADHPVPLDQPIPPNGSALGINISVTVPESQIGTPIPITVSCVRSGEPIAQTVEITVQRAADPIISVVRTADKQTGKEGDVVTLTYKLSNQTKFDMTNISVIDEHVSDNVIISQPLLRAGQSISIESKYTLGSESVVSTPMVTYTVNGKTKTFSAVDPLTITVVLVRLNMDVKMGTPTMDGVTFTLDIKNTGNQDITSITVTDDKGVAVNTSPFSLKSGENNTLSYQVIPVMTEALRNVKFTLKGTDALGGEYTLASTGAYEVYPFVDDTQINVTLTAQTITQWDAATGNINARVIITNHSLIDLKNIKIYESGNEIKSFDALQAGETTFDHAFTLGAPRNLAFTVKGSDPTGAVRDLGTCTLQVGYGVDASPDASITPSPQTSTNNTQTFGFLSTTISKILLALGVLMVISFIVLIILSVMDKSKGGVLIRFDEEDDDEFDDFFEAEPVDEWREKQEELSYTQRIRKQQAQKMGTDTHKYATSATYAPTAEMQRSRPAPTVVPPPEEFYQQPMVRYEYDEAPTMREDQSGIIRSKNQSAQPVYNQSAYADNGPVTFRNEHTVRQEWVKEQSAPSPVQQPYLGLDAATLPSQVAPDYAVAVGKRESLYEAEAVRPMSPYQPREEEREDAAQEVVPPKVIYNRPKPNTIPTNRNAVRHVHATRDQQKERE